MSAAPCVPWTAKDVLLVFFEATLLAVFVVLGAFVLLAAWGGFIGWATPALVHEAFLAVPDTYIVLVFYVSFLLALRRHILRRYRLDVWRFFFCSRSPWRDAGAGVRAYLTFFLAIVGVTLIVSIASAFLDALWGLGAAQKVELYYTASQLEQLDVAPIAASSLGFILVLLLGPCFEELVFRGFLFPALRRRFSLTQAALLSSAVFALFHGYFFLFPYVFVLGVVLAFLYERRGNLIAPVVFHTLNNGIVLVLFFLSLKR
ncbi:MAG: lysostaphin resistance A-like protein [Deltaproteobacteria bacterium]